MVVSVVGDTTGAMGGVGVAGSMWYDECGGVGVGLGTVSLVMQHTNGWLHPDVGELRGQSTWGDRLQESHYQPQL